MVYIPDDIWKLIAQFMSQDDLCGMIEVNSVLFHLGMGARYRSVSFKDFHDTKMVALRRLSDPAIAPRVHHLHVDLAYKKGYEDDLSYFMEDKSDTNGKRSTYNSSLEDVVQLLVDSLSVFSNVTHFSLDCPLDYPSDEQLHPLLTTAWNTFGSGLRKLVINVDMINAMMVLPTAGTLVSLQELQLGITGIGDLSRPGDMNRRLFTAVAPFINEVAPTLRILSLSSYTWFLNFSLLFNLMENIPNLEEMRIELEMRMCGLSDPRGLTRILHDHALTLRHFKWISHYHLDWEAPSAYTEWMKVTQSDRSILSNLLTLEIVIPSFPAGFDLTVGYIQRSADTLTSLSLSASYLSHNQVNTVLSIFTHRREEQRLRILKLRVTFLSLQLVLTLAKMLPCLHKLVLGMRHVAENPEETTDSEISVDDARKFADRLRNSDISFWQLYDLWIPPGPYSHYLSESDVDLMLMRQFAACVPSIQKFNGMNKDDIRL